MILVKTDFILIQRFVDSQFLIGCVYVHRLHLDNRFVIRKLVKRRQKKGPEQLGLMKTETSMGHVSSSCYFFVSACVKKVGELFEE